MKKFVTVALVAALSVGLLAGCGGNDKKDADANAEDKAGFGQHNLGDNLPVAGAHGLRCFNHTEVNFAQRGFNQPRHERRCLVFLFIWYSHRHRPGSYCQRWDSSYACIQPDFRRYCQFIALRAVFANDFYDHAHYHGHRYLLHRNMFILQID